MYPLQNGLKIKTAIYYFFSSDFIDHYLLEMQDAKDPTSTFYKEQGSNKNHKSTSF